MTSLAKQQAAGRAIVLVGFMGAGKTSVGRVVAERLGWRFTDLDDVVEAREGRTVASIFRESGEPAFRAAEARALIEVLHAPAARPLVLALGGGAYVQPENARVLAESDAPVIFLDAAIDELFRRCEPKSGQRPLLQDRQQFRQLYEARRQAYMRAALRVDTTGLSVDQAAAEVLRRLDAATLGTIQHGVQ